MKKQMVDSHGLPERSVAELHRIFANYPQVQKAVIYGSRATGKYRNGSDIDLTLYGNTLTQVILCKIIGDIDDSSIPYKLDLSIFENLEHTKLRDHIERVGKVFYEKVVWKVVKLGDICKLAYGKALLKEERLEQGDIPAYGANGVKIYAKKPLYSKPSIIIGRKGSAGELNKSDVPFWALDVAYYVVVNEQEVNLDFLYLVLLNQNIPSLARGVKPSINRNDVYSLEIPLPPLAEQQRIVAKLDAIFSEIDAAITVARKQIASYKVLKSAILASELQSEAT